jgi:hypothetical protein
MSLYVALGKACDRCEIKGCTDLVAHVLVKVDLIRKGMYGTIKDHQVRKHYVCSAHYIPLAIDIAGQATHGEIFG